jgi:outer membrane protein TolC
VERVGIASAYPNSNLMLGFSYAFSPESMKTFDRMTFSAGVDAMENLAFPSKVAQAGKVALDQARAAGERFRGAKFDLQKRVLTDWAEYGLLAERLRSQRRETDLSRLMYSTAGARISAGGAQQELLRAEAELRRAESATRDLEAQLAAGRAVLNGMLGRDAAASLEPESMAGAARPIPVDDATLLQVAAERNPELTAMARDVEGRADALELARIRWIPDINPSLAFTGNLMQVVGAAVVLPTATARIGGAIREAEADLRGMEAALRQARLDRGAAVVGTLVALRNADRQAAVFERTVVPLTERACDAARREYSAGGGSYEGVLGAERDLLAARLVAAEARAMRETRLAELEALLGTDIETLGGAASGTNGEASTAPGAIKPGEE